MAKAVGKPLFFDIPTEIAKAIRLDRWMGSRGKLHVIRVAAAKRHKINVRYNKIHPRPGEEGGVERVLEPYSFRFKRSVISSVPIKFMYGYHAGMGHQSIEMYAFSRVTDVKINRRKFEPRWPVEIGSTDEVGRVPVRRDRNRYVRRWRAMKRAAERGELPRLLYQR